MKITDFWDLHGYCHENLKSCTQCTQKIIHLIVIVYFYGKKYFM